jgi:hypothetical protein
MKNQNISLELEFNNDENLYFVTNITNLRSYLSLDAIVTNSCLETENFLKIDGNYFDNYLIASSKPLIYDQSSTLLETSNSYRIILEIEFSSINTKVLKKKSNNFEISDFKNLKSSNQGLILFLGSIPFQYIKKIYFRTQEELEGFYYPIENIFYPSHLYEVNEVLYTDMQTYDASQMHDDLSRFEFNKEIDYNSINKSVHIRNKIKSLVNGLANSYKTNLNGLEIYFDENTLDFFEVNKTEKLRINKEMNLFISKNKLITDKVKKINFIKSNRENSLIQELKTFFYLLDVRENSKNLSDLFNISQFSTEFVLLIIALRYLIDQSYLEKINIPIFLEKITLELKSYDDYRFNELVFDIQNTIKKVLSDTLSIKKIIEDKTNRKADIIIALMLFLKAPSFSSTKELYTNLASYNISPEIGRLTILLYNTLNGYASLQSELKNDAYLNRVCDSVSFKICNNPYLINLSLNDTLFNEINHKKADVFYTSSNLPIIFNIYLNPYEQIAEKYRKILIFKLNDESTLSNFKINLKKADLSILDILPKILTINRKDIIFEKSDETKLQFSLKNGRAYKFDLDIDTIKEKIVLNPSNFFILFQKDKSFWINMISNL